MPANLPPKYFEIEKKLRTARSADEKIEILEELLAIVPKHKGTEKLQAQLKSKMAKFRSESGRRSTLARHGALQAIKKSGAGQIVLVGSPNSGKSLLVRALSGTETTVGDYPFSTVSPMPAMMFYRDIQIQLIDTPPVTVDFLDPSLTDLMRTADGVIMVLDPTDPDPIESLKNLFGIFQPKKIEFIHSGLKPPTDNSPSIMRKKTLFVCTKCELPQSESGLGRLKNFFHEPSEFLAVSAVAGKGIEDLKTAAYRLLNIIRVYSKIPGKKAEMDSPFTLKRGSTVMDMARTVHKDFSEKMKFARIWGKGTFQGQMVKRDHVLQDEDVIELHI